MHLKLANVCLVVILDERDVQKQIAVPVPRVIELVFGAHDEEHDWHDTRCALRGLPERTIAIGLCYGSGIIVHRDDQSITAFAQRKAPPVILDGDFNAALPLDTRIQPHALGWMPQLASWVAAFSQFRMTIDGPDDRPKPPDFVYYIIFTELVAYFSFGGVQLYSILSRPRDYVQAEAAYVVLSLTSKLLLAGIFLFQLFWQPDAGAVTAEAGSGLPMSSATPRMD